MADARVFQEHAEAGVGGQPTDARVSQEHVDVGLAPPSAARVAQVVVEVAQLNPGAQFVLAGGIGSAEAFGDLLVLQGDPSGIFPAAIGTGEAVGEPTLTYAQTIAPTGIASREAVGTPTIPGFVRTSGIASREALGTPTLNSPQYVQPTSIRSLEDEGVVTIVGPVVKKTLTIKLQGRAIRSAEAVGTPTLTPGSLRPAAIASSEAVGTPSIIIPQSVAPTGIPSAEAVGTPSLIRPGTIIPDPIGSAEAVGTPAIIRAGTIEPTAIASSEAVGEPTLVTLEQTVLPEGIASREAFGTPTIIRGATHAVIPTAIPSETVFGTPIVSMGPNAPVEPPSIVPGERFGLPRVTLGVPAGPVGQPPGRIANRLYDPETGVAFMFAINHSEEDPRAFERIIEAGAPSNVGLSRQQTAPDPMHLSFRGTLLDPAQKTALDGLFDHCDTNTLIYEDYSGEAYEVIVTTWDCRPERARNPVTRGLHLWRYTIDLHILRVLHGAQYTVIGAPPPVPPDIVVESPPIARQPVGIASREAFGTPVVLGGDRVIVPTATRSAEALGLVVVTGGTAPGGGGPGEGGGSSIPAAFPSRLSASGTKIVDSNGFILTRMTGVNIHCLPTYIPSQADLHDIKSKGATWTRVVLHWRDLEPTQGVFNATMRTQIDTLLTRLQTAGLYAMFELHLNVGAVPGWTSGADETAKYANGGQFITQALAQRYAANKVVIGFGLNEIPLGDSTIRNGNNAIPYLEGVQRTMISWFRAHAPDWIGFPTLGYSNQTPYPDSPRTPASPTAYDSVGKNVVIDVHHYLAGVNSSDPNHDGRQPNGMVYPTYQGGLAIWMISDYPISYSDTTVHRAQIYAFLADYVAYCRAAQIPLMVGEVGWAANNTGGEAAWWAAVIAALKQADVAMVAQWIFAYGVPPQEYWAAKPNGVWEPGVLTLLSGNW